MNAKRNRGSKERRKKRKEGIEKRKRSVSVNKSINEWRGEERKEQGKEIREVERKK